MINWMDALQNKDKSAMQNEMAELQSMVSEAVEMDDQLFELVKPLDLVFQEYASNGVVPDEQELRDIVDALFDGKDNMDTMDAVSRALTWVQQRLNGISVQVTEDVRAVLDRINCLLQRHMNDMLGVNAGLEEVGRLVYSDEKLEVSRLGIAYYEKAGRWRGKKRDWDDESLKAINPVIRNFVAKWQKKHA